MYRCALAHATREAPRPAGGAAIRRSPVLAAFAGFAVVACAPAPIPDPPSYAVRVDDGPWSARVRAVIADLHAGLPRHGALEGNAGASVWRVPPQVTIRQLRDEYGRRLAGWTPMLDLPGSVDGAPVAGWSSRRGGLVIVLIDPERGDRPPSFQLLDVVELER